MEFFAGFLEDMSDLYDLESKFMGRFALNLLIGGALGVFIRQLYRRFSASVSNRDAFSANFPLLTITTVLVITVVKSSLALSLGLLGALSIVRFRAAIKDPEELIYLFFCIALGVTLGADMPYLAVIGVVFFTLFVLTSGIYRRRARQHNLLITISGDSPYFAEGGEAKIHGIVQEAAGDYIVQRLDMDGDKAQLRAIVKPRGEEEILPLMAKLQDKLPGCQVSYVNLDSLL